MKRFALAYICILCLSIVSPLYAQRRRSNPNGSKPVRSLSAQEIARRTLPAVVLVACDDGEGNGSLGSGFFMGQGIVVTNYHVVKDMVRGIVRPAIANNSTRNNWRITTVLNFDERSDLALLRILDAYKNPPPALSLSADANINLGETIYALGNPEGLMGTISPGIVSGLRSFKKGLRIQITAPISHGSSGGPVVNVRGEVIGVAQGSFTEGQNLNFAVPASLISSLLADTNIALTANEFMASRRAQDGRWLWPDLGVNTPTLDLSDIEEPIPEQPKQPHPSSTQPHAGSTQKESNYLKAIEQYKQAIKAGDNSPQAYYGLGLAYYKFSYILNSEDAIEALKKAIALKPNYSDAYNTLGAVYYSTQRYAEASEALNKAIRINTTDANAHYNLGLVDVALGDRDAAIAEWRTLKDLDKNLGKQLFFVIFGVVAN